MPELPEVETTLRGIEPHLLKQTISKVIIRHYGLRWPIARDIETNLRGQQVVDLTRRGKYLLLHLSKGTLLIHLGMSGRLQILNADTPSQKHDHVDVVFGKMALRFTDPRRFGAFIWTENADQHMLLKHLGVEPLTPEFSGKYLYQRAQSKTLAVKNFIMDQKIVVGVGNIYANEALFIAKIHPQTPAKGVSLSSYEALVKAIKDILRKAIKQGGTTLKDFLNSEGKPGYFSQHLYVYGRAGEPCMHCQTPLVGMMLGQRSTVFCERCQRE